MPNQTMPDQTQPNQDYLPHLEKCEGEKFNLIQFYLNLINLSFDLISFYSFLTEAQISSAIHYFTPAADMLPSASSSTLMTYLTMLIFESQIPVM